jgi:hypothetical protein
VKKELWKATGLPAWAILLIFAGFVALVLLAMTGGCSGA